jgi:nitrogen fixation protein FixH
MQLEHSARAVWVALLLLLAGGGSVGEAADYRVRKSVEGLTFEIAINRNPPVLGKNDIRVEIRDPQGQPVSGAEVTVNYYMPPMPRMPPMNYTVTAAPDGTAYRAVMDLIMAGPWNIIVRAKSDGKWVRVSFPIDVR